MDHPEISTLKELWRQLGIAEEVVGERRLPLYGEADERVCVETPQRAFEMTPDTAAAWEGMQAAARREGVEVHLVSAYRSYSYQAELIRRRLDRGEDILESLAVLAPPGCSEHHTGRALDLGTPGCPPLSEAFAETPAFGWLLAKAEKHGFRLSYPRGNPWGYIHEPWHWCFAGRGSLLVSG